MGARDYSSTAASNLSVQGISLAEGMARASVNNAQRAQLADIADLLLDLGGATTTTGSANAYLIALDTAPTALADNLFFLATSHATNTTSSTINVSGLGTKDIKKLAGGSAVSIGAEDFPVGHVGIFTYSSASNCFLMLNPATALLVGAETAIFERLATAEAAATAGTIPSSIDVIEVLGHTSPGDEPVVSYTREVAAPATGDSFLDLDGSFWAERAQGLQRVDGVAALRSYTPVAGRCVYLAYHTTIGDLGGGIFRAVRDDPPGYNVDNDGTIIVPTGGGGSSAWLRVWDGVKAHVGWFGARCTPLDLAWDDYPAVKKCFDLFTDGRSPIRTGIVDVGPGFCFSQPLIYGGNNGKGFALVGEISGARGGQEPSLLRYTGPETDAAIIFYGANEWRIENINPLPQLALNGVMITTDNSYNNAPVGIHTTGGSITAGANVVVSPVGGATPAERVQYLQPGVYLGVDAGGPNFEIVYISKVDTTAGTFTADFTKNHAAGVLLGGGASSSGGRVNRCFLLCPQSPIYTTLTAAAPGSGTKTFFVQDITGIEVGRPLRVGHTLYQEVIYPITIDTGAESFTAVSIFSHELGERVMYPTSAILFGNRLLSTVQVSEIAMYDTKFQGDAASVIDGTTQTRCYAGIRQIGGGNVKNFTFHLMGAGTIKVPFAFEQTSGQYIISGGQSGRIEETLFYAPGATITVEAWEDESLAVWLVGHSTGGHATFIGCHMGGAVPTLAMTPGGTITDEIFYWGGQLTFIGCLLRNYRIPGTTQPIITLTGIRTNPGYGSLALINCHIYGADVANLNFVWDIPGSSLSNDVIRSGLGKLVMLNCLGGTPGVTTIQSLPDIVPPQDMWQATATYDPPDLTAGFFDTPQSVTVASAALGDLVEASFSLDLNGAVLRAWVSAANTVKYQFSNPGTGTIVLASGTVKCRVKK